MNFEGTHSSLSSLLHKVVWKEDPLSLKLYQQNIILFPYVMFMNVSLPTGSSYLFQRFSSPNTWRISFPHLFLLSLVFLTFSSLLSHCYQSLNLFRLKGFHLTHTHKHPISILTSPRRSLSFDNYVVGNSLLLPYLQFISEPV